MSFFHIKSVSYIPFLILFFELDYNYNQNKKFEAIDFDTHK
jgi:hypothetical protein